jgi:hypothetical protein
MRCMEIYARKEYVFRETEIPMIPRPTRPANYNQVFQESQEVILQIVVNL